jgi:CDP-glucose 4,6-dehydratase
MGQRSSIMENMVDLFENVYYGKRIFITGNTGFKGSWLTEFLLLLGAEVRGYSLDVPCEPSIFEANKLSKRVDQIWGDIGDLKKLENSIVEFKPDFIFHLAAQALVKLSYKSPVTTFMTNVMGSVNVLEVARNISWPCAVVMITSDKCYENVEWTWGYRENDRLGGKDPYSASKGAAEVAAHAYFESYFKNHDCVKIATTRAGNVIGGGDWAKDRIVPDCFRSWEMGERVIIRNPDATRPWQHVLEPLSGYLALGNALYKNKSNMQSYNFGPGAEQSKSVMELLNEMASHWGDLSKGDCFDIQKNNEVHEAGLLKLSCDKVLHDLGWVPTLSFEETTSFTGKWYHQYYKNHLNDIQTFTVKQIEEYVSLARMKKTQWTQC